MKICFIHNSYGQEITSGAQRIVKNLAEYLATKDHQVFIITCGKNNFIEERQVGLLKIISLPSDFYNFKIWSSRRRLFSHVFGFINLRAYLKMRQIMNKEKFDLVWTHNLVGFGLIVARAIKAKIKLHTCHDIQLLYPSGLMFFGQEKILATPVAYIYRFFCRLVFAKDTIIIFPSKWLKELTNKFGLFLANKTMVLANPLAEIKNNILLNEPADFTFLFLGQLEKHKGVDLLIKAFVSLADKKCRLLIAGSGSLLEELKSIANESVIFLGNVNNPEEIIKKSSCVVVPSLCYENLPTAALEAMQSAVPVIGANLGGLKDLIVDEKLLFTPTENDIKKTLDWCLSNKEELSKVSAQVRQKFKIPKLDEYFNELSQLTKLNF